jgi:EmrB/QacA subfamily drug resistance transporter
LEDVPPFLYYGSGGHTSDSRLNLHFEKDPFMSSSPNPRRWWILAVLGIAQLMVVLDVTIVNIALPSAQGALGFSDDDRQWIVTAYSLAFGSLLLIGGKLGDLFGRKQMLIAGLIGFAAASAIGGAAESFGVLVAARAAQGAFGALLAPAALSLLTTTFTDPGERGKAFGIYGAIAGGGGAVGLLLGGVLTEHLSWRWTLYVNLLFAIPAAVGALALLARHARSERPQIDMPGTLTATGGLFALVYGFAQAETHGWGSPTTIGFLAGGVALLAAFVAIERRAAHPLLPLRVVLDRNRGGSYLALGIAGAGMFGVFLFLTYYLQQTLGYSPIETGFAFLPMVGAVMVAATLSTSVLLPRVGPRPLVTAGMLLAAGGMVLLAQLAVDSTYAAHVLPGLLLSGIGIGLVMAPAMSTGTLGVDESDAGVASATVNTMQQIGGALGTALLSTLSASAVSGYLAGKTATGELAANAAVHGYTTAFWWTAGIFAAGALVSGLLLRSGAPQPEPGAQPVLAH